MATHVERIHSLEGETAAESRIPTLRPARTQPLEFRERRTVPLLLVMTDLVSTWAAIQFALLLHVRLTSFWPAVFSRDIRGGFEIAVLLVPLGHWLAGLYPGYGLSPVERLHRRLKTIALVFAALFAWDSVFLRAAWPRSVIFLAFVAAAFLTPVVEAALLAMLVRARLWGTPAIVLSAKHAGAALAATLRKHPELGLIPIALLKQQPELWGAEIEAIPVIGPPEIANRLAPMARIAIIAMPGLSRSDLARMAGNLRFFRVIVVPELSGLQSLWVTTRDFCGTLGLELQNNLLRKRDYYLKRCLDYALGIPLLLLSAPLIGVLALWIKRVSPGPAFYCQQREGRRGRPVRVWKLRTMYPDAEQALERRLAQNPDERREWERFFKLKRDPRILPRVGHLLRKTSLDELPQLWNVVRGELSLVGPRPFPKYHMESFDQDFRRLRRKVLPGLTGLWQVSERSNGDIAVQERLDTYYIRNWSPLLDAYILARTVFVVFRGQGAY